MAKQSQLDKAIAQLKGEIAVLQLAIIKLEAQRQTKAPVRKPRAVVTDKSA